MLSLNSDSVRRKATLGIILQDICFGGGGDFFVLLFFV
jgi:hypothetical protein